MSKQLLKTVFEPIWKNGIYVLISDKWTDIERIRMVSTDLAAPEHFRVLQNSKYSEWDNSHCFLRRTECSYLFLDTVDKCTTELIIW